MGSNWGIKIGTDEREWNKNVINYNCNLLIKTFIWESKKNESIVMKTVGKYDLKTTI